jgi:hypothetical protein
MKYEDLLQQALEIEAPWQIVRMHNDLGRCQLDVWVARERPRRSWLFGTRADWPDEPERVWRHINVGQSRCLIHAPWSVEREGVAYPWSGIGDQPFTHALTRQIATHFAEGIRFQSICKILDIPLAELWKFKHNLDHGLIGLSGLASTGPNDTHDQSGVPGTAHPIWESLLDGSVDIDIRVLSLKLLLTKLRGQMQLISDPEVRQMKAHELQRYFVRYAPQLAHELAQIRLN